jgi:hypothetical protein
MRRVLVASLLLLCGAAQAGIVSHAIAYKVGKSNNESKQEYFAIYVSDYQPAVAGSMKMEVVHWQHDDNLQQAVWNHYPHIKWEDTMYVMQGKGRYIFVYYCTDKKVKRKEGKKK